MLIVEGLQKIASGKGWVAAASESLFAESRTDYYFVDPEGFGVEILRQPELEKDDGLLAQ